MLAFPGADPESDLGWFPDISGLLCRFLSAAEEDSSASDHRITDHTSADHMTSSADV